jgi:beta-phosphoglucomutase-like phosphatase (HAD superfamily)
VIDAVLEATSLVEVIRVSVSSEEVARGKPAPDVYLEAVRRLGVAPARAAAVEDSSNGLRSARAAGLRLVAVPHPRFPPDPDALALADVVLDGIGRLDVATVEALAAPSGA